MIHFTRTIPSGAIGGLLLAASALSPVDAAEPGEATSTIGYSSGYHSTQALEHAVVAATHGLHGHPQELAEHAEMALKHAEESKSVHAKTEAHLNQAIASLQDAVKQGKAGKGLEANKAIGDAVMHIKASY